MKSSFLKLFMSASLMALPLGYGWAADSDSEKGAQREAALSRIELMRETVVSATDEAARAHFYSEYGGNLEAYVLNGLSRSEQETQQFYREAYDAFTMAAANSSRDYPYSSKISDLAVKLNDIDLLRNYFDPYLETEALEQNIYVARIDYAYGLERFGYTSEAEELLLGAMAMRSPEDAYEATYRYLEMLRSTNRSDEALKLLESLPDVYREQFTPDLLYLKKELANDLGMDTAGIDAEIEQFLEKMSEMIGVGITQRALANASFFEKFLGIERAYAFSHFVDLDDSRGTLASSWWVVNPNLSYARWAMNGAEVLYNEARGEPSTARTAVAWAIRNRAFIDMNGADHYPGSQSDANVNNCRIPTPIGPQPTTYPLSAKYYSCVVHGDTWVVGGSHSQMDDSHVDLSLLMSSGLLSLFLGVVNNYYYDPSYYYFPLLRDTGNPNGAQEWRNRNYCAANNADKRRHGNVGGDDSDDGDICPLSQDLNSVGDNYFWGRKP